MHQDASPEARPDSRRLWIWSSAILAAAILAIGVWTACSTARTIHRTFSPVYYWDQWTIVDDLQHATAGYPIHRLWALHNEHRILVGRLALLADLKLFHGRNVSLVVEICVIQALLAALFTWMCGTSG